MEKMRSKSLRIVMVTPQWFQTTGGPTTYVSSLSAGLQRLGHDVSVLTPEAGNGAVRIRSGLLPGALDVYKRLTVIDPDVVHIHGRAQYIIPSAVYKMANNRRARIIFTFHTAPHVHEYVKLPGNRGGSYNGWRRLLTRRLLRQCDEVTSVSHNIVNDLNRYYGMGIKHYTVIRSGSGPISVDMAELKLMKDRYGLHNCSPVLCAVGVMAWDSKVFGYQICIEAVRLLRCRYPQIRLLIAGDGRYKSYLENLVRTVNLYDHVIFLGNFRRIPELLAVSEIYLLMAPNEGCPLSVVEAMRAEKPIIAANRGGIPEIVQNELTGLLIEPDAEELAHAVVRLVENKWEAKKLANQANEYARTNLNWETIAKQYLSLYQGSNSA